MSKAKNKAFRKILLEKIDYEPSVPRCTTCIWFRNNNGKQVCNFHHFNLNGPQGVCNDWTDTMGSTLEKS